MERGRLKLARFGSAGEAAVALAGELARCLDDSLAANGRASLAVPGGRTPVPLFEALRRSALDWRRVTVTLTDERWVAPTHPGSNEAMVRGALLQDRAALARWTALYDGSADAATAAAAASQRLREQAFPFDAVVLGMGEDGHFASLFPGNAGLAEALDMQAAPGCVATQAPVQPRQRLSLNLAALAATRRLFLLVSGHPKRRLLEEAIDDPAGERWPIGAVLALTDPQVEVYWSP